MVIVVIVVVTVVIVVVTVVIVMVLSVMFQIVRSPRTCFELHTQMQKARSPWKACTFGKNSGRGKVHTHFSCRSYMACRDNGNRFLNVIIKRLHVERGSSQELRMLIRQCEDSKSPGI